MAPRSGVAPLDRLQHLPHLLVVADRQRRPEVLPGGVQVPLVEREDAPEVEGALVLGPGGEEAVELGARGGSQARVARELLQPRAPPEAGEEAQLQAAQQRRVLRASVADRPRCSRPSRPAPTAPGSPARFPRSRARRSAGPRPRTSPPPPGTAWSSPPAPARRRRRCGRPRRPARAAARGGSRRSSGG